MRIKLSCVGISILWRQGCVSNVKKIGIQAFEEISAHTISIETMKYTC